MRTCACTNAVLCIDVLLCWMLCGHAHCHELGKQRTMQSLWNAKPLVLPKQAPLPPWLGPLQPGCCRSTGATVPSPWGIKSQILAIRAAEQVPDDRLEPPYPGWALPAPGFVRSVQVCPGKFYLGADNPRGIVFFSIISSPSPHPSPAGEEKAK